MTISSTPIVPSLGWTLPRVPLNIPRPIHSLGLGYSRGNFIQSYVLQTRLFARASASYQPFLSPDRRRVQDHETPKTTLKIPRPSFRVAARLSSVSKIV
ncbi:hypothetical protein TMatcc_008749 [Talaromyces marneffei ATCC 18224]